MALKSCKYIQRGGLDPPYLGIHVEVYLLRRPRWGCYVVYLVFTFLWSNYPHFFSNRDPISLLTVNSEGKSEGCSIPLRGVTQSEGCSAIYPCLVYCRHQGYILIE
jgi:hypothetical protein